MTDQTWVMYPKPEEQDAILQMGVRDLLSAFIANGSGCRLALAAVYDLMRVGEDEKASMLLKEAKTLFQTQEMERVAGSIVAMRVENDNAPLAEQQQFLTLLAQEGVQVQYPMRYSLSSPHWVQASSVVAIVDDGSKVDVTVGDQRFRSCKVEWNDPQMNKNKSDVLVEHPEHGWLRVWFWNKDVIPYQSK